jgi:hypothetical protein
MPGTDNMDINSSNKSLTDLYTEISGSSNITTEQEASLIKDRISTFEQEVLKMKLPDGKRDIPGLFPPSTAPVSEGGKEPPMDFQSTLMLELLLRLNTDKYVKQGMPLKDAEKQAEQEAISTLGGAFQLYGLDPSDPKNAPKVVEFTLSQFFQSQGTSTSQATTLSQAAGIVFSAAGPFMTWINNVKDIGKVDGDTSTNKNGLYNAGINACQNGLDLIGNIKGALNGDTTLSTDDKQGMINFMNIIGDTINKIKSLLIEIQIADSQKAGEISGQKQDLSKLRYESTVKLLADQFQQIWEAEHPPWWKKLLKILIPVITVLVSICISVATMGAGSPAAAVAAALIITAATVALSETGVLDKAMQGMMSGIVNMFKAMGCPESVANILAAVLVAIMVAVIAKGAPAAAGKVASEATTNVIKMVCFQLALTLALSSGGIQALVTGCWEASGKSKDDPELQKVIMGVMIAFTVIAMVGAAKFAPNLSGSGGSKTGKLAELAEWVSKNNTTLKVAAGVMQVGASGMSFAINYVQYESLQKQGKLALSIAELEALVTLLNAMVTQLQNTIDELLTHGSQKGKDAAELNNSWENMLNNLQGTMNQLFAA